MMNYKGYRASIEMDLEDRIFHGHVLDVSDMITFEGETVEELVSAFENAVDEYLAFCSERGLEAQKPYSGKIALRISPESHASVAKAAAKSTVSINTWISEAIEMRLHPTAKQTPSQTTAVAGLVVGVARPNRTREARLAGRAGRRRSGGA